MIWWHAVFHGHEISWQPWGVWSREARCGRCGKRWIK